LYLVRVKQEGEDKPWWVLPKKGLFDVKSFYSVMVVIAFIFLRRVFG